MEAYVKLNEEKEETLMKASERDTEKDEEEPKASYSNYNIDKLTSYPDLKPKFLEKEANLIEVNT